MDLVFQSQRQEVEIHSKVKNSCKQPFWKRQSRELSSNKPKSSKMGGPGRNMFSLLEPGKYKCKGNSNKIIERRASSLSKEDGNHSSISNSSLQDLDESEYTELELAGYLAELSSKC